LPQFILLFFHHSILLSFCPSILSPCINFLLSSFHPPILLLGNQSIL
jgi:hypothetical protein